MVARGRCVYACVRVRSLGLKWHSASASPDADIRAQPAHHFEVARHAPEPLVTGACVCVAVWLARACAYGALQ